MSNKNLHASLSLKKFWHPLPPEFGDSILVRATKFPELDQILVKVREVCIATGTKNILLITVTKKFPVTRRSKIWEVVDLDWTAVPPTAHALPVISQIVSNITSSKDDFHNEF